MTANSSINDHSPCSPVTSGGGGVNSPRSRSGLPWAQVVRGNSEAISAVPRSPSSPSPPLLISATEQTAFSDCSASKAPLENSAAEAQLDSRDNNNSNVASPKKPAWKKPLNGVVEVGPVMGDAVIWPALSESTRHSPKAPSDSSKALSRKSDSVYQGPLISHSPQKQANTNANTNMTSNHTMPGRQRIMKHRGGGGTSGRSAHSGFSGRPPPPLMPPPFPVFEMPYGPLVPAMVDSHVGESHHKGNNWGTRPIVGAGSHSHAGNDHAFIRNSSRKSSFGPRPHGGPNHHYSNQGDRDRRGVHLPHQVALHPRGFVRSASPGSSPFIRLPPVRPFLNPMGYDMASPFFYVPTLPLEPFGDVQLVAPASPPPTYSPGWDPFLSPLLINQIDYYFSDANLVKDDFLRSNMNDQGWVPISLIASFPRVQNLTKDVQLILDSLGASAVVEVQGDKLRRRDNWKKWIPPAVCLYTDSGSQSPVTSPKNILETSFQTISLDEVAASKNGLIGTVSGQAEVAPVRFSYEESAGQLPNAQGTNYGGSLF